MATRQNSDHRGGSRSRCRWEDSEKFHIGSNSSGGGGGGGPDGTNVTRRSNSSGCGGGRLQELRRRRDNTRASYQQEVECNDESIGVGRRGRQLLLAQQQQEQRQGEEEEAAEVRVSSIYFLRIQTMHIELFAFLLTIPHLTGPAGGAEAAAGFSSAD